MSRSMIGQRTLKRATLVTVVLILAFLFLSCRIFAIQVFDFFRYQKKVIDQLTTESPVTATRGEILDAAGRVLATERTTYRISVFPHVVAVASDSEMLKERIATGLSAAIEGIDAEDVRSHLAHTKELERTVARAVDRDTANLVLDLIGQYDLHDMIAVEAVSARYYPYGELASHVLGFTGHDGNGLYGLELQYNDLLKGKDGSYVTARDSMGNELPTPYESYIPAVNGSTLYTTLDAYVQSALEQGLEKALLNSGAKNRVCGIVMDVNTGAILAMATGPGFDLNDPFSLNEWGAEQLLAMGLSSDSEAYRAAKNRLLLDMWSNKAVTEIYMPGSTFKALTCSAVLSEKAVIDLDERFYCSGAMQVCGRTIHCHKVGGHGSITFREGLQNSCNPVMMTIAARLGCDTFYDYVKAFGLLEKTGIDLPGEGNSIFHAASSFTELDLATASFGQNFKVSILQMITAISAVANGGKLVTPYVVEKAVDASGAVVYQHQTAVRRQVVDSEIARTVCQILADGVAGNGGAKNAYVAGYRVAAKTGTSEKIGDDRTARIGSCVAFAPADDPQVAVIIVVDEPTVGSKYGSVVAAPYVAELLSGILPYLGVSPIYTEEELREMTVKVPNCIGWSKREAEQILGSAGILFTFEGEGSTVVAQSPSMGSEIPPGELRITLTLGEKRLE